MTKTLDVPTGKENLFFLSVPTRVGKLHRNSLIVKRSPSVWSCCGGWYWEQDELWADKITGFVIHTEQWSAAEKNRRLHSSGRYFPSTLTSNVTCVSWPLMWGSVVVLRAEITFLLWLLKETKAKEKRSDEKCCRYSRFKLPGCLWAVRDGADRNVLIFNRADVFLFPFLCVSASQINVTLHYNRSCRDYFSADRKPVRKRACRWQAFAFLCLVQWNARLCAVSEMQQSVSGVNTKTRVFFPGKDGSGLFISRALLHVRAPLPADGRWTLLQRHSFSINISYSRFTGFCFSVKSPVQPVRGRKRVKTSRFSFNAAKFLQMKMWSDLKDPSFQSEKL